MDDLHQPKHYNSTAMVEFVKPKTKYSDGAYIKVYKNKIFTLSKILEKIDTQRMRLYLSVLFNKIDYSGSIIGANEPLIRHRTTWGDRYAHFHTNERMKILQETFEDHLIRHDDFMNTRSRWIKNEFKGFRSLKGWYPHIWLDGAFRPLFLHKVYESDGLRGFERERLIDLRLWAFYGWKRGFQEFSVSKAREEKLKGKGA